MREGIKIKATQERLARVNPWHDTEYLIEALQKMPRKNLLQDVNPLLS